MTNPLTLVRTIILTSLLSNIAIAETLLQSTESWDGGAIHYPEGQAQITSIKLSLSENQKTPWHCHPVPTFGYILSGTLEVTTQKGESILMEPGQSLIEVMKTTHQGKALGGPVEILVFYAGAIDVPNTISADSQLHEQYCN